MGMTEADAAALAEVGVLVPEPRRKFMSKRKGEWELSEDAKAFGRSSKVDPEVKEAMVRRLDDTDAEIEYYRTAATMLKAKADAKLAVRLLAELDGEVVEADEWKQRAIDAKSREQLKDTAIADLQRANEEKEMEILRLRALQSMAVHSED